MARFIKQIDRFHLLLGVLLVAIILMGCNKGGAGAKTANGQRPKAKRFYGLPPGDEPAPVRMLPGLPAAIPTQPVQPQLQMLSPLQNQA